MKENEKSKYILRRNFYAFSLLKCLNVDGIIDDFSKEEFFCEKRIYKTDCINKDSLIVVASGGATMAIVEKLKNEVYKYVLDYFTFPLIQLLICGKFFKPKFFP